MKKNAMFIVAFAAISFLAACSGGPKDHISRKWNISGMQNPQMDNIDAQIISMDDSIKNCTDTTKTKKIKTQREELLKEKTMMNSTIEKMKAEGGIEFKKDGKYKLKMGTTEDEGSYSLDESGKKLMLTNKERTDTLYISELTNTNMTILEPRNSTKIMFTAAEVK